eukprot:m.176024 g.176024  ORF g.176024 m.176024 type:complete len:75 (+) comp15434_c0_seq30:170-394(+)
MMCIMGPRSEFDQKNFRTKILNSGSGKTSFINILSGRPVRGAVSGSITVNNRPPNKAYKRQIAYVKQGETPRDS